MSCRKVHFSVPLHQIEYLDQQWETASRLARDGSEWVRIGLDRQRFQDRIERTAEILNKILDINFRRKIYHERFENFVITNEQQQQQEIINKLTKTTLNPSENEITYIQSPINASQRQITDQQQENKKTNTNNNSNNHRNKRRKRSRRRKGNIKNNNRCKHRGGHRKKN